MAIEFEYEDRLTITTPEGVDLRLTLAGVGSRFIAAIVDALIEAILITATALLVFLTNGFGAGANIAAAIFLLVDFLIFWGYDVAFEVLASGRTPGKRWNGLRVILEGGQPIGFRASSVRNLVRLIDWLPFGYLVGMIAVVATEKNQRLGDILAGTVVVRERRDPVLPAPLPNRVAVDTPGWDVSAVTAEEVATVRRFLERRSLIDLAVRREIGATLAARLRPKVAGAPEDLYDEGFLEQLVLAKTSRT